MFHIHEKAKTKFVGSEKSGERDLKRYIKMLRKVLPEVEREEEFEPFVSTMYDPRTASLSGTFL